MVESSPTAGSPGSSRRQQIALWLLHFLAPQTGAVTGAVVGFRLYFETPGLNRDTLAPVIFAGGWALLGVFSGGLITYFAGWLIERRARRLLPDSPFIRVSLTILLLIGLCVGLYAPLEARLPGLIWPKEHQQQSIRPAGQPLQSQCTQAPPSDPKIRRQWDLECR